MLTQNGTTIAGNICRKPANQKVSNKPSSTSAQCICKGLGFHGFSKVGNLGSAFDSYDFAYEYGSQILIKDLEVDCLSTVSIRYQLVEACTSGYYYTYLSCSCHDNHYVTPEGCVTCPGASTSYGNSGVCECPVGNVWEDGECLVCAINTYFALKECLQCPRGSWSEGGTGKCLCFPGYFMGEERCDKCEKGCETECEACEEGWYSYSNSTECAECPGHLTAPQQDFCLCSAGSYWSTTEKECVLCPDSHFSDGNTTYCAKCPEGSASPSHPSDYCICPAGFLWHSAKCRECPENHYSSRGAAVCIKCEVFHTAAPGSDTCLRCTLGQYSYNHSCLSCPDHMFGDGIQCWECPPGLSGREGFCVVDQTARIYFVAYVGGAVIVTAYVAMCGVMCGVIWRGKTRKVGERQDMLTSVPSKKDLNILQEECKSDILLEEQTPFFL